jgi:hypothetical protein
VSGLSCTSVVIDRSGELSNFKLRRHPCTTVPVELVATAVVVKDESVFVVVTGSGSGHWRQR